MVGNRKFKILSYIHKARQVFYCIPTYFDEIAELRSTHNFHEWCYFKFPNLFPLSKLPIYLTVELTNKCNLRCTHCWRAAMTRPIGDIELSTFQKIVAEASEFRPRLFKIGGSGEPATHPNFSGLMQYLSTGNLRVMVYTNGLLLERFSYDEILSWGLDCIVVSVDGLDARGYEKMKIGSDYATVRKSVSSFRTHRNSTGRNKPALEIRHIITPEESGLQLVEFSRDWRRLADRVSFNTIEPPDGLAPKEDETPPKCRQIRRELAIQWDGRVPVCGGYRKEYIGNIQDSSISELWRHSKLEYLRLCNQRKDFDKVPTCRRCCHCR